QVAPLADGGLAGEAGMLAGEIELRRGNPSVAAAELISTARRLVPDHRRLAATTLMLAGEASFVAGDNARYCAMAQDAARIRAFDELPATRVVLEHFAAMSATFSGRHHDAAEPLRRVVDLGDATLDPSAKTLASQAAFTLGEAPRARTLAVQAVTSARARGELAEVPWSMIYVAMSEMLSGQLATATATSLEALQLAESLGQSNSAVDHLTVLAMLAALQGDQETAGLRLAAASAGYVERGLSRPGALGTWAAACVDLAHDRPAEALDRFRRMSLGQSRHCSPIRVMAVPHFVEAAVRCGEHEAAYGALTAFERWATTTGGASRIALAHRCRALLAEHEGEAEEHFTEAMRLHRESDSPHDLAGTEMLYAARLRRNRRPKQAREVLREAVQIFDELGARHWVDRAWRELRACGHPGPPGRAPAEATTPPGRGRPGGVGDLSPQQEQIAALVAEGATNREIAARLYISHRTVDHHLRNIFAKLDIRSRVELTKLYR
ncbi:LuxR family transcriptional regulator, partial [Saccharomonospora iraqiensis]|uniref:LuxR family transcriptional regulator n=1 Tax=Saccharomonospora iraqiensis TaxID=52698 RepID=UPI00022E008F